MLLRFALNGRAVTVETNPVRRLVDVLRDDFNLYGVKEGCGEGECGACSVLIDGKLALSCILPVGLVHNKAVTTIEGLRVTDRYRLIEDAFIEEGAVQCGFCTPGMVMAAEALLSKNPKPEIDDIREALSGNLCRCTGYNMIVRGVRRASERGAEKGVWAESAPIESGASISIWKNKEKFPRNREDNISGIAYRPFDLEEAKNIRKETGAIPFAGGTDLMVQRKRWDGLVPDFNRPVIFLSHLEDLTTIESDDKETRIGSCCTYTSMLESNLIPGFLKTIASQIASPPIRNIATIGGNICNASPAGDILPALYATRARVILESVKGCRILPVGSFITGPGSTSLKEDEILTRIIIPKDSFSTFFYRKVGTRKANALSKLSFFGLAKTRGDKIEDIRISFGALAPIVVQSTQIEKDIAEKSKGELKKSIPAICGNYSRLIAPIDDQRSTARYRKTVALKLLTRFLEELAGT
ncbi:MAG: hypothetical protein DRP87_03265 [Spirochaetes bacterium]|nr:MAG: hypothetical protein DRP87_03265 [Spirochaetota bacterium]